MLNLGSLNEKTTAILSLEFTDENGTPVIPANGEYRIDTVAGFAIKATTPFTPTSSRHQIDLSVSDNTMHESVLITEPRIITITWQYGTGKQGTEEYKYNLKNLQNIS